MEGPPNKGLSPKEGFSGQKIPNFGSKETNENDNSGQTRMNAKMHNPKKPVAKHFMSPTISAASKVSVPRKNILGERNGIPPFSDVHLQKSPNFGLRNDLSPKITSSKCFALESVDDEKIAMVAYDPSSTYLSPRPKYLRYNPNRRREETDFQNVLDDEVSSSDDDEDSLTPSESKSLVNNEKNEGKQMNHSLNVNIIDSLVSEKGKQHCEDKVEDDSENEVEEEVEQYEKVKGWSLKGILNFLLVLSILVLATSFMFSMDYTVLNSDDVITAFPEYGFNSIREIILEDLSMCMNKDRYETYMGVVQLGFEELKQFEDNEEVVMESGHEPIEIVETQVEWNDVAANSGMPEYEIESVDLGVEEWNDVAANSGTANFINRGELQGIQEQSVDLGVEHECGEEQTQSTELVEDQDPLDKTDMVESKDLSEDSIVDTMGASEMMLLQKIKNTRPIILGIIGALFCMVSGSLFFISRSKGRNVSEEPVVSKIIPVEKHVLRRCDQNGGDELIEYEDSNNIQERKKNSVFQITSSRPALAALESSSAVSHPGLAALESSSAVSHSCYGSFTTETKILKKEKGKDAEFTTPVRRSSRIRSKSMTSP